MNITLEEYIGIERSNALHQLIPALLFTKFLIAIFAVGVLSLNFEINYLLIWLFSVLLILAVTWSSTRKFTPETTKSTNYQKRLNVITFWYTISGVNWGLALLLLYDPENPIYTLYLMCLFSGYISISVSAISLYLPVFVGFAVPSVLSNFIRLILEGEGIYLWMAITLPMYVLVLLIFAKISERNFKLARSIEYENQSLLNQVTEEKNRAETAVNDKNQFLAAISHDLRQPLHAMNLYIDALDPRLSDPLDKSILEKIGMSGNALNDLLHGLLDISRLDASVVENHPQHLNFATIANDLKEEFLPQAREIKLDLIIDVDDKHIVYADPMLLERVIRNLLSNAIKYTKKGHVSLSSTLIDDKVSVTINDTGIGVPEDMIGNIFLEFTQIGNPERDRNKGVGLGLSIVKRLCDLQGIKLLFESQLDQGTRVNLLVKQGDKALLPLFHSLNDHRLGSLTILFIDDEKIILDGMEMIIRSWKCQPLIASDGESALKLVRDLDVSLDIIISDLRLRDEESGINVIEAIREELNEDVPAIVVTGDTAVDRIELVKNSNLVLMHKPLKPADLRQQIQQLLDL